MNIITSRSNWHQWQCLWLFIAHGHPRSLFRMCGGTLYSHVVALFASKCRIHGVASRGLSGRASAIVNQSSNSVAVLLSLTAHVTFSCAIDMTDRHPLSRGKRMLNLSKANKRKSEHLLEPGKKFGYILT